MLADLAAYDVDVVLSDAPASPVNNMRVFSHLLGESGVSFFALKKLAPLKKGFPRSLDGAPFLLPLEDRAFRRDLNEWFYSHKIQPLVQGEFADFALLRVFAEQGFGIFAAPSVIEEQLRAYRFQNIGKTNQIAVRFYALSLERQLQHPAVVAICDAARRAVFR